MLEKTVGATKKGQSRDTRKIGYTRHWTKTPKTEKKHNTENFRMKNITSKCDVKEILRHAQLS